MMDRKIMPKHSATWRGYTLDELRYERVIALTRIEIEKAKMLDAAEQTRDSLPLIGRSAATSMIRSISLLDYVILAVKLYRKIAPLFRKKK